MRTRRDGSTGSRKKYTSVLSAAGSLEAAAGAAASAAASASAARRGSGFRKRFIISSFAFGPRRARSPRARLLAPLALRARRRYGGRRRAGFTDAPVGSSPSLEPRYRRRRGGAGKLETRGAKLVTCSEHCGFHASGSGSG